MDALQKKVNDLKENEDLRRTVNLKIQSFKRFTHATNDELFKELCYCILTANCNAQNCLNIQTSFPNSFSKASKTQIRNHLKKHNYRFPNIRSQYIIEAQPYKDQLGQILQDNTEIKRREWLVNNIKGFGLKEASHFLRNIGYDNYAIIDTHILTLLQRYHIIEIPKVLSKEEYTEIEQMLKQLAKETNLTCASLDLYLWYDQTGMILK
ncbi:MAG: N-glycosylase/DNA lyase [Candidatus Thermoplasmatota archaeon]|nr:N-glycosylase/DNA lyase [Candidatus Thermoplasmatota archaeon]